MNSPWIERLGNWNPQVLRELRGRLRLRSFIAAIGLSFIIQSLVILIFIQSHTSIAPSNWADLWKGFAAIYPYLWIGIGGFYLVSNLNQEEKSGTLDFIRLSPRPAWQILLGKLLGVPILPSIALALCLPLHWIIGILGHISLGLMLSFYLTLGIGCLLSWSFAILFGLVGSQRSSFKRLSTAISATYLAIAFLGLVPFWQIWNHAITWNPLEDGRMILSSPISDIQWTWITINENVWISHSFTLIQAVVITFLLWRVILRRFRRPRTTLLSRRQSYFVMAYLMTLFLGFFLNSNLVPVNDEALRVNSATYFSESSTIPVMLVFFYLLSLALMSATCPGRQSLMEWSRQPSQGLMGLVWADKSPIIISHAILLIIANVILVPLILLFPYKSNVSESISPSISYLIIILGVTSTLMMIGMFMQYIQSLKLRNPSVWFMVCLLLWWIVPPVFLGVLGLSVESISATATVWAFFGYPFGHLSGAENLPLVLFGIFAQWGVTALLIRNIQNNLSSFQELLA